MTLWIVSGVAVHHDGDYASSGSYFRRRRLFVYGLRNVSAIRARSTDLLAPVQIYTYAIAPYEDWHRQALAGALVLVLSCFR